MTISEELGFFMEDRDTVKCCGWISSHPLEH